MEYHGTSNNYFNCYLPIYCNSSSISVRMAHYPQTQQSGRLTPGDKICFYSFWTIFVFPLGLANLKHYFSEIVLEKEF